MRKRILLVVAMLAFGGCSGFPNVDRGNAGCQNAKGIGPQNLEGSAVPPPFLHQIIGRSPAVAAEFARELGHTVVFNVQTPEFGECWCEPPSTGRVVDAWWGQHGALWMRVESAQIVHSVPDQPFLGWGC